MRLCHGLLPILCASTLAAQQSSTAGAPDTSAFRRLELPTANAIAPAAGRPGPTTGSSGWTTSSARRSTRSAARCAARSGSPTPTIPPIPCGISGSSWTRTCSTARAGASRLFEQRSRVRHRRRGGRGQHPQGGRAGRRGVARTPGPARVHPAPYVVNGTVMRVDLARPLPPKGRQVARDRAGRFPSGPTATGWASRRSTAASSTRWRSGILAWRCTTTCGAGTPSSTSARASSTSSTAAST